MKLEKDSLFLPYFEYYSIDENNFNLEDLERFHNNIMDGNYPKELCDLPISKDSFDFGYILPFDKNGVIDFSKLSRYYFSTNRVITDVDICHLIYSNYMDDTIYYLAEPCIKYNSSRRRYEVSKNFIAVIILVDYRITIKFNYGKKLIQVNDLLLEYKDLNIIMYESTAILSDECALYPVKLFNESGLIQVDLYVSSFRCIAPMKISPTLIDYVLNNISQYFNGELIPHIVLPKSYNHLLMIGTSIQLGKIRILNFYIDNMPAFSLIAESKFCLTNIMKNIKHFILV